MGANTVADVKSASGPKVCRPTAGSSHAANADPPAPMVVVQPAEPSARAQLLDQLDERRRVELVTAQRPGLQGAEDPSASEAVDQVDGHGAGALGLAGRADTSWASARTVERRWEEAWSGEGAVERVGRHGVVLNRVQWVVTDTGVCIE